MSDPRYQTKPYTKECYNVVSDDDYPVPMFWIRDKLFYWDERPSRANPAPEPMGPLETALSRAREAKQRGRT